MWGILKLASSDRVSDEVVAVPLGAVDMRWLECKDVVAPVAGVRLAPP